VIPASLAGLRLPILAAPLFIVSSPELLLAQCRAGIVGSMPSLNARSTGQLDEWLDAIEAALADGTRHGGALAPFAVNLIAHKTNQRLDADLEICVRRRVPIVITSLGAREEINQAIHGYGGLTFHDVINDRFARKAIEKGADGLIAVAAGAGGHAGSQSPFALIQEVRAWFEGPLVLSGAIANGRSVLAAKALGADFAYVGSPFIATLEANASDAYKAGIVAGHAADVVNSDYFTGVHGNYLRESILAAGLDPENLPKRDGGAGFGSTGAKKAWRDIWGVGQGIGAVTEITKVAALLDRVEREYREALAQMSVRSWSD
jgi:nitronate monooxygenase